MQVKLFNTRIDADTLVADQQAINSFMETVTVKNTATQFVNGSPDFWSILIFYESAEAETPKKIKTKDIEKPATNPETVLSEEQNQILGALKTWRKDRATELQLAEFMIFPNATLDALARTKPRSTDELSKVKGIGQAKINSYGDDLMAILNAF